MRKLENGLSERTLDFERRAVLSILAMMKANPGATRLSSQRPFRTVLK